MNFKIKTPLKKDFKTVFAGFDQQLFEFLLPPKSVAKLIAFGGSKKGDIVHIGFLLPYKAEWISEITHDEQNENECIFIDEGMQLPFGLKTWTHKHIVRKEGNGSVIVDDITFTCANQLLTLLFYPIWYMAFSGRKKQYKKYFEG